MSHVCGTYASYQAGCRCSACKRKLDAYRLRRWGITLVEYDRLYIEQGFGCAICGAVTSGDGRLHVDHDHACCASKTGCRKCIRGLLCHRCNNWAEQKMPDLWREYAARPRPFAGLAVTA